MSTGPSSWRRTDNRASRMMRSRIRFASLTIGLAGLFAAFHPLGPGPEQAQSAGDVNCSDFANQAAAQSYFIQHGGPNSDPAGLDADNDGVACESLPCPCSSATGGGGGS